MDNFIITTALYSSSNIETISTQKIICDEEVSYAFTEIVFFEDQFYLTYRKSNRHDKGNPGKIKIYNSLDGKNRNFIK